MLLGKRAKQTLRHYKYHVDRVLVVGFSWGTLLACMFLKAIPLISTNATVNVANLTGNANGCSFSSVVSAEHSITLGLGESATDFGLTKMTTICTNSTDHQIYAIGYSNNTDGNTSLINPSNNSFIPTGISNNTDSTWSMKIAKDNNSYLSQNLSIENSFGSNHIVPEETTLVSSYTGSTDDSIGSSVLSSYQVRISDSQLSGNYSGKVKYTLVATRFYSVTIKPTSGIEKIILNNVECTSTLGCVVPELFAGNTYDLTAVLTPGYEFTGWTATTNGEIDDLTSINTTYTVGDDIETITASALPIMQNMDTSLCTSTPITSYDTRDGQTYTIKRLEDGNCWMMGNLSLGRSNISVDLTSSNTNLANTVSASTFNNWKTSNSYYSFISGSDDVSGVPYGVIYDYYVASAGTISDLNNTQNATYDICPAGWRLPTGGEYGEFHELYTNSAYNTVAKMRASVANNGAAFNLASDGGTNNFWSSTFGVEINKMLALSVSESTIQTNSEVDMNTKSSVRCIMKRPEHTLTISYGQNITDVKLNGETIADGNTIDLEEGVFYDLKASTTEGYGFNSWSSGSGDVIYPGSPHAFFVIGSNDTTLSADNASYVSRELQSIAQGDCTITASYAKDNRDGKVYTIKRLADGRCWMVENLSLGETDLSLDLTSSNTNIIETVSYSTFNGWKKSSISSSDTYYTTGQFKTQTWEDDISETPYGTLYNYYVATAGTITGKENYNNAHYDICPAGWRMPALSNNGESGDYISLRNAYSSNDLLHAPIYKGGAAFINSSSDPYWTNVRYIETRPYENRFVFYSTLESFRLSSRSRPMAGYIRCILKNPSESLFVSYDSGISQITVDGVVATNNNTIAVEKNIIHDVYITNETGSVISNYVSEHGTITAPSVHELDGSKTIFYTIGNESDTLTISSASVKNMQDVTQIDCSPVLSFVKDSRDGTIYGIKRLADGNCWMMDNLSVGASGNNTSITANESNMNHGLSFKCTSVNSTYGDCKLPLHKMNSFNNALDGPFYSLSTATGRTDIGMGGAIYDICPAGWRLPTKSNFEELFNTYSWDSIIASIENGGLGYTLNGYFNGYNTTNYTYASSGGGGYYWTSTINSSTKKGMVGMIGAYNRTVTDLEPQYYASIRCMLKKPTHTLTVVYGAGTTDIKIDGTTIQDGGTIDLEPSIPHTIDATVRNYMFNNWSSTSGTVGDANSTLTTFAIGNSDATLTTSTTYVDKTIQNLTSEDCTSVASKTRDVRDGQIYTVQRLADGNCWMMDNLNLGADALSVDLTSANTNVSSTVSAETFNSWKKYSATQSYNAGVFIPVSGIDFSAKSAYGTLYNYHAATAGTVSGSGISNSAEYDICPAGWRLPTGGDSGDFKALYSNAAYNSFVKMHNPIDENGAAFTLSGIFSSGTPSSTGDSGYYWSSSYSDSSSMHALSLYRGSINSVATSYRYYGLSVRCVLKRPVHNLTVSYGTGTKKIIIDNVVVADGAVLNYEEGSVHTITAINENYYFNNWSSTAGTIEDANVRTTIFTIGDSDATLTTNNTYVDKTIQNLASEECTTTAMKVKDSRDGQVYTVKRLADGNCWMMDNLNLGEEALSNDLTSVDTNISTTIPASTFNNWRKTKTTTSATYTTGILAHVAGVDPVSGNEYGTLYNYYAASGGTISGSSNNNNAIFDICPAGWRLPTGGAVGEQQLLFTNAAYNTTEKLRAPESDGGVALSLAGWFTGSSIDSTGSLANYLSSTSYYSISVYSLGFSSYSGTSATSQAYRNYGSSIRCVLKKASHILTVLYNGGVSSISIDGMIVPDGGTVTMEEGIAHNIKVVTSSGYAFDNWSVSGGIVADSGLTSTKYMIGDNDATLSINSTYINDEIQNLSQESCTTSAMRLKDSRDGQIYTVQRLADGNCWMMNNLNLGYIALTNDLTSSNTNISSTVSAATFNGWRGTASTTVYTVGRYLIQNGSDPVSKIDYGVLYNYHAASAGTVTGNSYSGSVQYDICPAGWRMPTGGSSGEISTLYSNSNYGTYDIMRASIGEGGLAFTLQEDNNYYGYYWTSTRNSSTNMYYVKLDDFSKSVTYANNYRYSNYSVRCILKNQ